MNEFLAHETLLIHVKGRGKVGEEPTEHTEYTEELRGEEAEKENWNNATGSTGCPRITLMGANGEGRGADLLNFLARILFA